MLIYRFITGNNGINSTVVYTTLPRSLFWNNRSRSCALQIQLKAFSCICNAYDLDLGEKKPICELQNINCQLAGIKIYLSIATAHHSLFYHSPRICAEADLIIFANIIESNDNAIFCDSMFSVSLPAITFK